MRYTECATEDEYRAERILGNLLKKELVKVYDDDEVDVMVTAEGRLQMDYGTDVRRVEAFLHGLDVLEVDRLFEDDEPVGQLEYKIRFSTLEYVSGEVWDWGIDQCPGSIDEDLARSLDVFSRELKERCQDAGFYAYLEVDKVLNWE